MTVRVNKSSFNIREKLSELGRKFGLKGSELAAAETVQEAREIVSAGRKNMVINGDMRISQRVGTTATTTTSGGFVIDRYRCEVGAGGATTQQQVTDTPPGFYNSMKITVTGTDTSVSAGDYHYIRHIIEGNNINHLNWGSSNAKPVTLSFWVKSSLTGDHGGALWNRVFNRSFPFNYTINSANAWEYKSITVPGCTDGSWDTGTDRGINIGFVQLSGSTYTGPPGQWNSAGDVAPTTHVNLLGTNGATWYITGIQLEVGRNATEFEHRSYGEELALCQRYYLKTSNAFGCVYQSGGNNGNVGLGICFPVDLRVAANNTITSLPTGTANNVHNFGVGDNSYVAGGTYAGTTRGCQIYLTGGTARTIGTFSVLNTGAEVSFNAEL
jgi:hypothetical protein